MAVSFKAGFVTIAGSPNVGKSTLLNALLDRKLSIVSPKPQTTRHRVLGILNGEDHQIVFLDTPGIIEPKYALQKAMVRIAQKSVSEDADVVIFLLDASEPSDLLDASASPKMLLLNKIDLVSKSVLLPMIKHHERSGRFRAVVPISALKRDGFENLLALLLEHLPENPPFYPPEWITDHPERFFVSEIIRERVFFEFGDEIPYAVAVRITEFRERPGEKDYIAADIVVERESQKGILIGSGGRSLKKLGTSARAEIERFLERPVYLELFVRLEKNWRRNERDIRRLGYG